MSDKDVELGLFETPQGTFAGYSLPEPVWGKHAKEWPFPPTDSAVYHRYEDRIFGVALNVHRHVRFELPFEEAFEEEPEELRVERETAAILATDVPKQVYQMLVVHQTLYGQLVSYIGDHETLSELDAW